MGFRYRKSKNVGPFRINFGKNGIGWSVGGKGFRYTKKANGGTRTTTSIPGSGMSWVKDYSDNDKTRETQNSAQQSTNSESEITTGTLISIAFILIVLTLFL